MHHIIKRYEPRKHQENRQLIGGKNGSKSHLITDVNGIPISITITKGNLHDSQEIGNLLKARICKGKQGKKKKLIADKGYIDDFCKKQSKKHHINLEITAKNRYAVERTHEHFKRFRKLFIRYERKTSNFLALFKLATAIMVFRKVCFI